MRLRISSNQASICTGRLFAISLYFFILCFAGRSEADIGISWLDTQATTEGSYTNNADLATTFQATAEAMHTLYAVDVVAQTDLDNSLLYLNADTVRNTEYLSRALLINTLAASETSSLTTDLLNHSNPDGGFADFAGHESTAMDTAFALEALAVSGTSASQIIGDAVAYLAEKQNPDGGFSLSNSNDSNVYITSLSISALQPYIFQYNVSGIVSSASEYLFSRQLPSGGWGTDWETAIALSAVVPITTDLSRYADAVTFLQAAQSIEGSWSDSVYTTALALRVLHNINKLKPPVDVNTGVLAGRLVNAASGFSLQFATVTIQDIDNLVIKTDVDGGFTVSNLPASQSYTVIYNATGFQEAMQNTSVVEGQQTYLGVIQLNPLPDIGFLAGIVTDAETGQTIGNAAISVTNETENIMATTGVDGSYFITINPGTISITVTAAGYTDVTASGTVILGNSLSFSPALYSEGSSNPGTPVILRGTVIDADTLTPLPGVNVSIVGSVINDVLSDDTGSFVLTDVSAGEIQIQFQLIDYQSTRLSLVALSGGDLELGNIQMRRLTGFETSISGTVTDNATGNAIAGASIEVMGLTTTSDVVGNFFLAGITGLDFSVSANAVGYLTLETQLVIQEPGSIRINIPMQPAVSGELDIVSVLANQSNYGAYNLVVINSLIQNTGVFNQDIQLLGEIIDPNAQLIHRFPLSVPHDEAELGDSVTVAANESVDFEGLWSTDANVAGHYQVKVKVFDTNNGQLLAEKTTSITINETQEIRLLRIKANPSFSNRNDTENIELTVEFLNLSNSPVAAEYNYSIRDPDAEIIKSGAVSLQITPSEKQKSFVIDDFIHTFEKSGSYTIELQHRTGTVASQILAGSISVAPNTRVELNQNILPSSIIPDGDKRIRIGVGIIGVQQP